MPDKKESKDLRIKYVFPDDYNPQYVNGAYGHVNPLGEIIVNFYLERMPLLREQRYNLVDGLMSEELLDDRIMSKSNPEEKTPTLIRYIEHGVIWNYGSAKSFHKWLGDKLSLLEDSHLEAKKS